MGKIDYKNSALLVIDVQRYFFEPDRRAFLKDAPRILPNILKLIDTYRKKGLPVIFTRHAHVRGKPTGQMGQWWGKDLPWEGSKDAELIAAVLPLKTETVITKTTYSAFEGTNLDALLKKRRVSTIVLCGVMTNCCIETTARHAFIKNYQPVVIEDATAGKSTRHHRASILNLSYGFAFIEKTSSLRL